MGYAVACTPIAAMARCFAIAVAACRLSPVACRLSPITWLFYNTIMTVTLFDATCLLHIRVEFWVPSFERTFFFSDPRASSADDALSVPPALLQELRLTRPPHQVQSGPHRPGTRVHVTPATRSPHRGGGR